MPEHKALHLPEELDPTLPYIEILGNTCVLIANHTGVRAYDTHQMVIGCKKYNILVQGVDLELAGLSLQTLTVHGQILHVGFSDAQGGVN